MMEMFVTHLHVAIFPREKDDCWETGDDTAFQNEDSGPHQPVQGHHARRIILAGLATLGTGKTLEHSVHVILALFSLRRIQPKKMLHRRIIR